MPSSSLSSSKTPHRRRRRKVTSLDKENNVENSFTMLDDEDVAFSSATRNKNETQNFELAGLQEAQTIFRKSLLFVKASLFLEHEALDESVVQTSLLFSLSSPGLWHVQEQASLLLSIGRKIIKQTTVEASAEAKTKASTSSSSTTLHQLFVALHSIRAVVVATWLEKDVSQQETCLRLLYHLACLASDEQCAKQDYRWHLITISAWEAVHGALQSYPGMTFRKAGWQGFMVPQNSSKDKPSGKSTAATTMTVRQICTIVFKACQKCVAATHSVQSVNATARQAAAAYGKLTQHIMTDPQESMEPILQYGYRAWYSIAAVDEESSADIMAHAKSMHRWLWTSASQTKYLDQSLSLRRLAIEMLLPLEDQDAVTSSPTMCQELLEAACHYAWKAATAYMQQQQQDGSVTLPLPPNSSLHRFHSILGPQLDDNAKGHPSVSYVEYCLYRALHSGIFPDTIVNAGDDVSKPMDVESFVMNLMSIGIETKHLLEGCVSTDDSNFTGGRGEQVVEWLERMDVTDVLLEWNTLPSETLLRYLKLFSSIALHRTLFQALKISRDEILALQEALTRLGLVLSKGIGPLLLAAAIRQTSEDSSKQEAWMEIALECMIRSMSVFEKLRGLVIEAGAQEQLERMTDDTIRHTYHLFFKTCPATVSIRILEKCAKSMSLVARQRMDASNFKASVLPTLYSLPIYRHLVQETRNNDGAQDYQVAARLAHLANTLQTSGLHTHAMVALGCTIVQELPACYSETGVQTWRKVDFLQFLASRSKGVFSSSGLDWQPTVLVRSSMRKLVSIRDKWEEESKEFVEDNRLAQAWDEFLRVSDESICHRHLVLYKPPPIANLLPELLKSWSDDDALTNHLFLVLVDVAVEFGASLESAEDASSLEDKPWQQNEIVDIVDSLRQFSVADLEFEDDIVPAMIKVIGATSLIRGRTISPLRSTWDESEAQGKITNPLAINLLKDASNMLQNRNGARVEETLLHSTIAHFLCCLEEERKDDAVLPALFQTFEHAMELYRDERSEDLERTWNFHRANLFWTLSHFHAEVEMAGDELRSVVVRKWLFELLAADGDVDEISWLESTVMPAYLNATDDTSRTRVDNAGHSGPMHLYAEAEVSLASLRAMLIAAKGDEDIAQSAIEQIQNVESALRAHNSEEISRDIFVQWILSTAQLAQAEGKLSTGRFTEALRYLQSSSRCCMKVVSLSKLGYAANHEVPVWARLARSTFMPRAHKRYIDLLGMRSKLYVKVGDHRKAIAYLGTLSDFLGVKRQAFAKRDGPCLEKLLPSSQESKIRHATRLNMIVRCLATPQDIVVSQIVENANLHLGKAWSDADDVVEKLGVILDVVSVGDLIYGESIESPFQPKSQIFYQEALEKYSSSIISNNLFKTYREMSGNDETLISAKMAVKEIRCLVHQKALGSGDGSVKGRVEQLCHNVINSTRADAIDKVWALYYCAYIEIFSLRMYGGIQRLWKAPTDAMNEDEIECLEKCRAMLMKAIKLHDVGGDIVSRLLLRSLALVTGPENEKKDHCSAGISILLSIGQNYRQLMVRSLQEASGQLSTRSRKMLDVFDNFVSIGTLTHGASRFLDLLSEMVPQQWKFVAATICPSGEVLMTTLQKDSTIGALRFSTEYVEAAEVSHSSYDEILMPLDQIIEESQNQLCGMDASAVTEKFNKEEAKRKWWDNRHQLDEQLQSHLERIEGIYFPSLHQFLDDELEENGAVELPIGNLADKFDAAVEESQVGETQESLRKLTVPKLKAKLNDEFGISDSALRKLRKQDLIDLCLEEASKRVVPTREGPSKAIQKTPERCLFLVLDENLHRFPFEGMPSLAGCSVCRVPSLSFVLATLLEREMEKSGTVPVVDPSEASFVLDPERNLLSTRHRIQPMLQNIATNRGWDWDASVGEMTPPSFFEEGLCRRNGLFMYFGHGGAQSCFSRKQVESFIPKRGSLDASKSCNATVILMGCSSGRLVSINRKNSRSLEQMPLYFEPEGIALSYLCAGAPCVVGNLWDVTDHDIDRYSSDLLKNFLEGDGEKSLASYVTTSRSACKLQYIVGCAPVCYGVPVKLMPKK